MNKPVCVFLALQINLFCQIHDALLYQKYWFIYIFSLSLQDSFLVRMKIASGKLLPTFRSAALLCSEVKCEKTYQEKNPAFRLETIYILLIPLAQLPLTESASKSIYEIFNRPTSFARGCSTNNIVSHSCPKRCPTAPYNERSKNFESRTGLRTRGFQPRLFIPTFSL